MNAATRRKLTEQLSRLSGRAAADIRGRILGDGSVRAAAEALHAAENVGQGFELWTDLLARRAAVMWVLRSVYLRVLEDRGLLRPQRLLDEESEQLFRRLAPDLGEAAYLRWVYRDLASPATGLAELFAPTPAEVAQPGDDLARDLLDFWRAKDPDSGDLRWRFDGEDFDSRLLGDLYQDLDPVVKERYALLQTPDFVVDFMLDRTLTPALARWGPEDLRLLDPACGSGHFLLAGFHRIFAALRLARPDLSAAEAARHVLARVVGIDLNDYACALARARLLMAALEASGSRDLHDAHDLHPQVFWADGLDQPEREENPASRQLDLFGHASGAAAEPDLAMATLSRPEVRARLAPLLAAGFHVVVANPPYITERDERAKGYHKEKVGGRARYVSATGKYSLVCPFIERCFQLAVDDGAVGLIVANSFMKREFGKALVEQFLPQQRMTLVIDSSGAYIPGHGTPTVLLFGERGRPDPASPIRTVMGKRGEPTVPADPAQGLVWTSIAAGHDRPGFENEFVSVADLDRRTLGKHPWSLQGGGAAGVQAVVEGASTSRLRDHATSIGFGCITGEDEAFVMPLSAWTRRHVPPSQLRQFGIGQAIRDWTIDQLDTALFPYDAGIRLIDESDPQSTSIIQLMWPLRRLLHNRPDFSGAKYIDVGRPWLEYHQLPTDKLRTPLSITFAFVATHNHFVLDRGGKVFNRSAPVIKLPPDAGEDAHLGLLGLLNASVACFWMKQVFQDKGVGGIGGGIGSERWELRHEHDSTKLLQFPIPTLADTTTIIAFARRLDGLAAARVADTVALAINTFAVQGHTALTAALAARRDRDLSRLRQMVALQEELDWYAYGLYGIAADLPVISPAEVSELVPGHRAFEIILARHDLDIRETLARGEDPGEQPTAWFARHGWEPVTEVGNIPDLRYRAIVEQRLALIDQNPSLALLEQPTYKRRWFKPDHAAQEAAALDEWLADRLEDWAREQPAPWPLQRAAAALETDAAVQAVAQELAGRRDYQLEAILRRLVEAAAVPNCKSDRYSAAGLEKRAAWEHTWALQHAQDRGEDVTVPVPPRYGSPDFAKPSTWRLRGKLDVPKERFIAFTEMPGATGDRALYGWAGWTPRQRARILLALDDQAEAAGAPLSGRYGLLWGVWFLLPWVAWEAEAAAAEFRGIVQDLVGRAGVTEAMLGEWAAGRMRGNGWRRNS